MVLEDDSRETRVLKEITMWKWGTSIFGIISGILFVILVVTDKEILIDWKGIVAVIVLVIILAILYVIFTKKKKMEIYEILKDIKDKEFKHSGDEELKNLDIDKAQVRPITATDVLVFWGDQASVLYWYSYEYGIRGRTRESIKDVLEQLEKSEMFKRMDKDIQQEIIKKELIKKGWAEE